MDSVRDINSFLNKTFTHTKILAGIIFSYMVNPEEYDDFATKAFLAATDKTSVVMDWPALYLMRLVFPAPCVLSFFVQETSYVSEDSLSD